MRMHSSGCAPIVLVAVLSLMGLLASGQAETTDSISAESRKERDFMDIQKELDKFHHEGSTDLTIEDLTKAYEDYTKWPESKRNALRSLPKYRLVLDLAIAPMQVDSPPELTKIKETYTLLKNCYELGRALPGSIDIIELSKDYRSLIGLFWEIKYQGVFPIKLSHFVDAEHQWKTILDRINHLAENGLVYEELDEFIRLVNIANYGPFKPLFLHVFPEMKTMWNTEILQLIYLERVNLYGRTVDEEGNMEKIDIISRQPGFMLPY